MLLDRCIIWKFAGITLDRDVAIEMGRCLEVVNVLIGVVVVLLGFLRSIELILAYIENWSILGVRKSVGLVNASSGWPIATELASDLLLSWWQRWPPASWWLQTWCLARAHTSILV